MRICMSRSIAAISATLLAGLMAACGSESAEDSPSQGKSSAPTLASTAKPSASAPTAAGSKSSTPSGSKQTASAPSPSNSTASLDDIVFRAIEEAEKTNHLTDIGLTNNSACDRSKGETLELSKFVGGWSNGPYAIVSGYADAPINLIEDSYTVTPHKNGNPRSHWSFSCSGGATGYYTFRFVNIIEGGKAQVTEEVGITVSE